MRKNERNIAVIHTRLKCIDGVSIECDKWINAYKSLGFRVHLIAGKICERTDLPKLIIPEMDFTNSVIRALKKLAFESPLKSPGRASLNSLIKIISKRIKKRILRYIRENNIRFLSIENALSIPLNIPLGVALKEIAEETKIPIIARHHDFYWERPYFCQYTNIPKILNTVFPPKLNNIIHICITKIAKDALKERRGIDSYVIPNTIDFDSLQGVDNYNRDFREHFGLKKGQFLFLQPTRIIRRKRIERAIEIVAAMNERFKNSNVLMITGPPIYGDISYVEDVVTRARELNVELIFAQSRIGLRRKLKKNAKIYSIYDAYVHCDVVTFPSDTEGFGNPILEACAYKKPLFVNRFPVFRAITRKKGFDFITFRDKITESTVEKMYMILKDEEKRREMVERNYEIAKKYYSYHILKKLLRRYLKKSEKGALGEIKKMIENHEGKVPKKE